MKLGEAFAVPVLPREGIRQILLRRHVGAPGDNAVAQRKRALLAQNLGDQQVARRVITRTRQLRLVVAEGRRKTSVAKSRLRRRKRRPQPDIAGQALLHIDVIGFAITPPRVPIEGGELAGFDPREERDATHAHLRRRVVIIGEDIRGARPREDFDREQRQAMRKAIRPQPELLLGPHAGAQQHTAATAAARLV